MVVSFFLYKKNPLTYNLSKTSIETNKLLTFNSIES